jgi:hypothetical protein
MSDGKDLKGFNEVKPVTTTSWSGEQYAADPNKTFSATDKSTQDGAGVGNGGK